MVVIMSNGATMEQVENVKQRLEQQGCRISLVQGEEQCILGIIGSTSKVDKDKIEMYNGVEKVMHVQQPYKLAGRHFHPHDSIIEVSGRTIGGDKLAVMAGPCSVESEDQIVEIAKRVKNSGAGFLRGGAFKPRTSPYSFQGLKQQGLELLLLAKKETGLPIVTEIMSPDMIDEFQENVDIIQVGARNMQNFELLKELGRTTRPILLKRGLSATIEEWIMSAEYIMSEGNQNVIFCERGIRTFETYTRNTLDLSAIPAIKRLSHLPIIVDPSHSAGMWWMVEPLAKAAIAVGADGLMIEVHNDPENAKCDGQQSIKPERFDALMQDLTHLARIERKAI